VNTVKCLFVPPTMEVFLGGSCNPTTWRRDTAIPLLEQAQVTFYNPQQDKWVPEMAQLESVAKGGCDVLLFVIDKDTRALASMIEVSEYITSGRVVVLVVQMLAVGGMLAGEVIGDSDRTDMNRARVYMRELASRYPENVTICPNVDEACAQCIRIARELREEGEEGAEDLRGIKEVEDEEEKDEKEAEDEHPNSSVDSYAQQTAPPELSPAYGKRPLHPATAKELPATESNTEAVDVLIEAEEMLS